MSHCSFVSSACAARPDILNLCQCFLKDELVNGLNFSSLYRDIRHHSALLAAGGTGQ